MALRAKIVSGMILTLVVMAESWGQEPLRSRVNLVTVSFTARNATGGLVADLKQEDISVLEDGVEQKISFFAKSADVPLTLGLIVDASGSQDHFAKDHEKDLEVFLKEVLGPKDKVFVVGFGNHVRLVNDFTQSANELLTNFKLYEKKPDRFPEIGPKEDRDLGTAFYDSIYYATVEKLQNAEGRKALLIFSDGEDNSSSHDMMTSIEAAQAANVLVFTIRYTETDKHGKLTARNQYGIRVMERIAKETGAFTVDAKTTDPKIYFGQIAEELRTSYAVGYYPGHGMKDERFRRIEVAPKDESIKIRCKTGYFAR